MHLQMNEPAMTIAPDSGVESVLREDLARGDAMLATLGPVLRHLVASDAQSVFGDEVIARVRGMVADLAGQLLRELDGNGSATEASFDPRRADRMAAMLIASPPLLAHVHALALEGLLAERLQAQVALDPVLPPLLQALVSSADATTSALAMKLLAAQSRFVQAQRRMSHPLTELPGDLLHGCLLALGAYAAEAGTADAAMAERAIRARYDEAACRLGLAARLVMGMGAGAVAALSLTHAGPALFLTALALAGGHDRDLAVFATNEDQAARLVLVLRAAGLKPQAVAEQFLVLHPDRPLPQGLDSLGVDRASALLAVAGGLPVS